ncbi:hypothetical protein GGI16_005943 [Coemansia sp. S142-1]|nr:hypothetical protein GGI16_005943 [Coemansia sp. S142-1]
MSSVSLRVSKGGSKFAPKAKPRAQRPKPVADPGDEGTATTAGTPKVGENHPANAMNAAMGSPMSSSRRSGFGSQLNSPRGKRHRTGSSTPEPTLSLKLKTADDYRVLDLEVISSLPIGFFCRDTRHGRPTQEFIEKENDIVRKIMEPKASPSNDGPSGSTQEKPVMKAPEPKVNKVDESAGPSNFRVAQLRIVDGKTVVDSDSLVINRREMADANQEPLELVDETSRSRYVNAATWAPKRGTRKRWTTEEEDVFFRALRKYGSDFEMIASMMPGRNRYDIKNKFKKEERLNGKRITNLLLMRAEPIAATPPATPAVGPDGLPVSLEGYSMVNTPDPQYDAADDDDEELPDPRSVVTFASTTK